MPLPSAVRAPPPSPEPQPSRAAPDFQPSAALQQQAREALDYWPAFLNSADWQSAPSPVDSAKTWRMSSSPVFNGPVRPFKAEGIVRGVSPAILAAIISGITLKWPERSKRPEDRKKKQEVRRVSHVDWETQCWFEHERIPVPLVADRETVYLETVRGLGKEAMRERLDDIVTPRVRCGSVTRRVLPGWS